MRHEQQEGVKLRQPYVEKGWASDIAVNELLREDKI